MGKGHGEETPDMTTSQFHYKIFIQDMRERIRRDICKSPGQREKEVGWVWSGDWAWPELSVTKRGITRTKGSGKHSENSRTERENSESCWVLEG